LTRCRSAERRWGLTWGNTALIGSRCGISVIVSSPGCDACHCWCHGGWCLVFAGPDEPAAVVTGPGDGPDVALPSGSWDRRTPGGPRSGAGNRSPLTSLRELGSECWGASLGSPYLTHITTR